ncbi:hypothetical protein L9F63_025689, partial [Diploptera punctata]
FRCATKLKCKQQYRGCANNHFLFVILKKVTASTTRMRISVVAYTIFKPGCGRVIFKGVKIRDSQVKLRDPYCCFSKIRKQIRTNVMRNKQR